MVKCIADLEINISDNEGTLRDISEIVLSMKELHKNFNTDAMSEHETYLKGQKYMLEQIIDYLSRI